MTAPDHHRYLRAAKRRHADPAALFAAARSELSVEALAQLVRVLRDHHDFKLGKADRDALIDDLLGAGLTPTRISNLIGCTPRTVTRRATEQPGSTEGLNKRGEVDKSDARDPWPILSFSADSGARDERPIRRALSEGKR